MSKYNAQLLVAHKQLNYMPRWTQTATPVVCLSVGLGKRSPRAVPGTDPGVRSRWKATGTDDNADKTACN